MNEEYIKYDENGNEVPQKHIFKKLFKAFGLAVILAVYIILFIRMFVSCDSEITDEILKTPEIIAAAEAAQGEYTVQGYEVTDWYKSKNRAGEEENGKGGKLLSVSDLIYIPETENLQITVKFNLEILKNRELEYSAEKLPFKLYLEDEQLNKYTDCSAVKYDERYSFGYIRICFDGIRLIKDDGSLDEDGDPRRKNYEMYLEMMGADGEYEDEVYDQFSIYTGKKYYKTVRYK